MLQDKKQIPESILTQRYVTIWDNQCQHNLNIRTALISLTDMDSESFIAEPHSPGNDTNITDVQTEQHGLSPITEYILMILFSTCACIVVIGNGLVLFGLARFKILRHPSNIFVGVLSGVDMTLSISLVMLTIQVKNLTLFDGRLFYCQFRVIIISANLLSSQLLLLGMYYIKNRIS